MKHRSFKTTLNAILNSLSCETMNMIVLESGFNSRQALSQWLIRNKYRLVRRYELIKIEESKK